MIETITLSGLTCHLAPEKALFLPAFGVLLISDLHFGKVAHFRKHGIGVPPNADVENLARMEALLHSYAVTRVVLAGDAFHSVENQTLGLFAAWRARHPAVSFELVQGNHDVMRAETYKQLGITLGGKELHLGTLGIVHDPDDAGTNPDLYYLAGHVHPGARLEGMQGGITLPALVLGNRLGLLPAFGQFTGRAPVDTSQARAVYLFSGQKVFAMPLAMPQKD